MLTVDVISYSYCYAGLGSTAAMVVGINTGQPFLGSKHCISMLDVISTNFRSYQIFIVRTHITI